MNHIGKFLARIFGSIITLVLIGCAISLAISNPEAMVIKFWPLTHALTLPIWLVILASFSIGLILGGIMMLVSLFNASIHQRRLNKRIKILEKEKLELSNELDTRSKQNDGADTPLLGADDHPRS